MALDKLKILVELRNTKLQFNEQGGDGVITALFNPNRLSVNRSTQWQNPVAKRDNQDLQFTGAEPSTLSIELFFDTYDSPDKQKGSVQVHTNKLHHLTTIEKHGDKHRPPVCRLVWGSMGMFFQGVLQQVQNQFTLFMEDGTPVRATSTCTFKEWKPNKRDLQVQNLESADVAKVWVVKRGETLASIAAYEYGDPRKWRSIGLANGIDKPDRLHIGSVLMLPALRTA